MNNSPSSMSAAAIHRHIETYQTTSRGPIRMTVTRADLEWLAKLIASKHEIAIRKSVEIAVRTHEENLRAITEYAAVML